MTDYFSLLNEPRRPWLDTTLLRQKFLGLAAEFHPDRVHQAAEVEKAAANRYYAELNAAWQCLAEPKLRLLHLLELERGGKPGDIQIIPPALADLFASISEVCQQADIFLLEREKVTSPLLKIHWFERAQEWIERLNIWQKKLGELRDQLNTRLEVLDEQWTHGLPSDIRLTASPATRETADNSPSPGGGGGHGQTVLNKTALLARLEELYRFYGYLNRWQNQLQERIARLSF